MPDEGKSAKEITERLWDLKQVLVDWRGTATFPDVIPWERKSEDLENWLGIVTVAGADGLSFRAAIIRKGGRRDWSWTSVSVMFGSGLGSWSLFIRKPEWINMLT
jgi:hypothetical protein